MLIARRQAVRIGVLAAYVFPAVLSADAIVLRRGGRVSGTVIGQTNTTVQIRTRVRGRLRVRAIPKANIVRILYSGSARTPVRGYRSKRRASKKPGQHNKSRPKGSGVARTVAGRPGVKGPKHPNGPAVGGWSMTSGALWRAGVLPGWGHYYLKQDGWAKAYGGLFACAAIAAALIRERALKLKDRYETNAGGTVPGALAASATGGTQEVAGGLFLLNANRDNRNFQAYEREAARLDAAVFVLGIVYLTQFIHASLASGLRGAGTPAVLDDGLKQLPSLSTGGAAFALSVRPFRKGPGLSRRSAGRQDADWKVQIQLSF